MATFVPRLDSDGMWQNPKWYADNVFYTSGYGLPNCTCYAWGRFWEIGGGRPALPTSNGGEWWADAQASGAYQTGQVAQVGAVACYEDLDGGAGHVAVVERINADGTLLISQSAWRRPLTDYPPDMEGYFWTNYTVGSTNMAQWLINGNYAFQGFIYHPDFPPGPTPTPTGIPAWMLFKFKPYMVKR